MPNGANNNDPKRTIIKLFDLGELISAPVTALLEADYQSARRVIDLIQHFGFEPPEESGGDAEATDEAGFPRRFGKMRTVSFVVRRQQGAKSVPYVIRVPLLSLVPLPLLQIKEADFDFSVRVLGGFIEDVAGQAVPDHETPPGLGPVTRDGPMLMGATPPTGPAAEKPRPRRPQGPPAGVIPLRRRRRRAAPAGTQAGAGMLLGATPTERGQDGAAEEPPQRLLFSATLGRDGAAVPRDGTASLRAEGNMKVHITMRQGDMPEGIAQLLNMLTQQISREEIPPEAPPPDQPQPQSDGDDPEPDRHATAADEAPETGGEPSREPGATNGSEAGPDDADDDTGQEEKSP